jgi:RNA processing factor Prp31
VKELDGLEGVRPRLLAASVRVLVPKLAEIVGSLAAAMLRRSASLRNLKMALASTRSS